MEQLKFIGIGIIALSASAVCIAADDPVVGKKVDTPVGTVKVDKGSDGSTTVRGDNSGGPSVTVKNESPTRDNPKGDTQATVGVTKEF